MLTIGIDLSADPTKTGLARLRWHEGRADVEHLSLGWEVEAMADEIERAEWSAIDAPFGWPDHFVATLDAWAHSGRWPAGGREKLRYRLTDERVSKTKYPLSVSSDRIASTAMRCAQLLDSLASRPRWGSPVDRAGGDQVLECYPAAALTKWGLATKGYKGSEAKNRAARDKLLARLAPEDGWLVLSEEQRGNCIATDDYFDALVCGLVARAAERQLLDEVLPEHEALAQVRREGWIHLPAADSLAVLPE